mmetsp:Transcript_53525/g.158436  ORF Transcript_53525/g.158436 Transcript_53525/m.158436 type:complete len:203 (-) Transcript_53525:597-1205(-)
MRRSPSALRRFARPKASRSSSRRARSPTASATCCCNRRWHTTRCLGGSARSSTRRSLTAGWRQRPRAVRACRCSSASRARSSSCERRTPRLETSSPAGCPSPTRSLCRSWSTCSSSARPLRSSIRSAASARWSAPASSRSSTRPSSTSPRCSSTRSTTTTTATTPASPSTLARCCRRPTWGRSVGASRLRGCRRRRGRDSIG